MRASISLALCNDTLFSMASKCELQEESNGKLLNTLREEVEMTTFDEKLDSEKPEASGDAIILDDKAKELLLKIICIGGFTGGVGTKGVLIDDYLQVWPPVTTYRGPLIGANFYLKSLRWQRSEGQKPISIKLQFWEIAEQERYNDIMKLYFKDSVGALVFWGARRPSTLEEALLWRAKVKEICPSIPCVLVTENIGKEPLQWIGPGKIFESDEALEQFCNVNGFVDHFEINSRDWESGEKSVFGQAVICLLNEIFKNH